MRPEVPARQRYAPSGVILFCIASASDDERKERMFDNLSERLEWNSRQPDAARCAVGRRTSMPPCARCGARCSKPTSRSMSRAPSSTGCARRRSATIVVKSVTPGQMVVKIVHDELVATLGSDAQPHRSQCAGAGRDHDGRPAGLRQNHDHRQDRQAPHRAEQEQGADGLARHPPSGGDGAACGARPAGRRRHAADRRQPDPAADRQARDRGREARRL